MRARERRCYRDIEVRDGPAVVQCNAMGCVAGTTLMSSSEAVVDAKMYFCVVPGRGVVRCDAMQLELDDGDKVNKESSSRCNAPDAAVQQSKRTRNKKGKNEKKERERERVVMMDGRGGR